MFVYCTRVLCLSEHAAYGRIEAARLAPRFPSILTRLADGSLTLTNCALLGQHLTAANHTQLLDAAAHKSKRDVEHLIAALRPQPAVPSTIRKPEQKPKATDTTLVVVLEFHHVEPYAAGGETSASNLDRRGLWKLGLDRAIRVAV